MDNTVKILIIFVVILVGVLAFAGSYILSGEDKNITNNQTNQTNITVNNTTEPSNAPDASARTVCTVWPCNGKGYWTCQTVMELEKIQIQTKRVEDSKCHVMVVYVTAHPVAETDT